MARLEKNSFDEEGINPFNAPIPGESLTASPENAKAWRHHLNIQTKMKL